MKEKKERVNKGEIEREEGGREREGERETERERKKMGKKRGGGGN